MKMNPPTKTTVVMQPICRACYRIAPAASPAVLARISAQDVLEQRRQTNEDRDDDGHPLQLVDLLALLDLFAGVLGDLALQRLLPRLVARLTDAIGLEINKLMIGKHAAAVRAAQ